MMTAVASSSPAGPGSSASCGAAGRDSHGPHRRSASGSFAAPRASASTSVGCTSVESRRRARSRSTRRWRVRARRRQHRHAQKFTTHSGLFQPRMKTRSPRCTPTCAPVRRPWPSRRCAGRRRSRRDRPGRCAAASPQRSANASRSSTRARALGVHAEGHADLTTSMAICSPQRCRRSACSLGSTCAAASRQCDDGGAGHDLLSALVARPGGQPHDVVAVGVDLLGVDAAAEADHVGRGRRASGTGR